jgi:hypothetical protein
VSEPSDRGGGAGPCPATAAHYRLLGELLPLGPWLQRWRHLAETHPAEALNELWEAHKESRRQIVVDVHFDKAVVAHLAKSERLARVRGLKARSKRTGPRSAPDPATAPSRPRRRTARNPWCRPTRRGG